MKKTARGKRSGLGSRGTSAALADVVPRSPAGLILVADDEPEVRQITKVVLERCGYRVIMAGDGASALESMRAQAGEISLVLLDVNMPGLSAEAVIEQLREIRPDVPVLLTSGFPEEQVSEYVRSGLISGFVQKPYAFQQLADEVDGALGRGKARSAKQGG